VGPITAPELDEAVEAETPRVEELLVSLTRAKVELKFGNGLSIGQWLLPILQSTD
jgi:hypothetical protein